MRMWRGKLWRMVRTVSVNMLTRCKWLNREVQREWGSLEVGRVCYTFLWFKIFIICLNSKTVTCLNLKKVICCLN